MKLHTITVITFWIFKWTASSIFLGEKRKYYFACSTIKAITKSALAFVFPPEKKKANLS